LEDSEGACGGSESKSIYEIDHTPIEESKTINQYSINPEDQTKIQISTPAIAEDFLRIYSTDASG
jgi:hypothetical protein